MNLNCFNTPSQWRERIYQVIDQIQREKGIDSLGEKVTVYVNMFWKRAQISRGTGEKEKAEEDYEDPGNVLELVQFFPLADRLIRCEKRVVLRINTGGNLPLRNQIKRYLRAQSQRFLITDRISIFIDQKEMREVIGPCDSFSSFINEKNRKELYDEDTAQKLLEAKVIQRPDSFPQRILLLDEQLSPPDEKKIRRGIQAIYKNAEIEFAYKGEPLKKNSRFGRALPLISVSLEENGWDVPYSDLIKPDVFRRKQPCAQLFCLYELCDSLQGFLQSEENYIGIDGKADIESESKRRLAMEMSAVLKKKLNRMPLLSKLIWLFLLRDLLEEKELLHLVEAKTPKWLLNLNLLETSYLSAVAYADGLLQVIVNACLYSAAKKGYFCMSTHRIGRNGVLDRMARRMENAQRLYDRYRDCFLLDTGTLSPINLFTRNYSRLIEFYVYDDAGNDGGILPTAEKNYKRFDSLDALLDYSPPVPNDGNMEDYAADVANHYGLRVFYRTVVCNDGYIKIESPDHGKTSNLFHSCTKKQHTDDSAHISHLTQFRCLLPLFPKQMEAAETANTQGDIFEAPNGSGPYRAKYAGDVFRSAGLDDNASHFTLDEKKKAAGKICSDLREKIGKQADNVGLMDDRCILTLDCSNVDLHKAELLAKALFQMTITENKKRKLCVAVLFEKESIYSQAFLRIFFSFYDKIRVQEPLIRALLSRLHLAICTYTTDADGQKRIEVGFILAGQDRISAFLSAKNYLYMNFHTSKEFIPVLKYLVQNEADAGERASAERPLALFRFDIYLSKDSFDKDVEIINPRENSLFLNQMHTILNTDMREHEKKGCLIPDIHMRIGSKLHLDRFYEAELLFRNIGNVYSFAAIIADDLLQTHSNSNAKDTPLLLVGYERYSAELVMQIGKWLKPLKRQIRVCVIPVAGREIRDCIELAVINENNDNRSEEQFLRKSVEIVSVIPVGCTLSNAYKIRNIVMEQYGIRPLPSDLGTPYSNHYCIVAVNSQLTGTPDKSDITWSYWDGEAFTKDRKQIVLRPEKSANGNGRTGKEGLTVQYLLAADAKWYNPPPSHNPEKNACPMCRSLMELGTIIGQNQRKPLLQVDKTSMIPESTFYLRNSRFRMLLPEQQNKKDVRGGTLEQLEGTFYYGHIYEENNHYQFYFDLKKVYEKNKAGVDQWLDGIKLDRSAFHIVIAPSSIEGTPFVNAVLSKVFHNSLHFLHIDLNSVYREDVRLKFSHIADEYRYLREHIPTLKMCFYYVDESIISTQSISRAKLLARMLLNESGLESTETPVFAKAIIMICQSSFDTMQQFVENPAKDVESWIMLNIPPYNTKADRCPACELLEKYARLRERSATDMLSGVFEKMEIKHRKRTKAEYKQWLSHEILTSHSYYMWFKQLVALLPSNYVGHPDLPLINLRKAFQEDFNRALAECADRYMSDNVKPVETQSWSASTIRDAFRDNEPLFAAVREELERKNLQDLLDSSFFSELPDKNKVKDALVDMVEQTVVAKRNLRRLVCLQTAYQSLMRIKDGIFPADEPDDAAYDALVDLIGKKLSKKPAETMQDVSQNAEWLISYIKVISRDHLTRYYHIHKAIVNLMYDLLLIITSDDAQPITAKEGTFAKRRSEWMSILKTLGYDLTKDGEIVKNGRESLSAVLMYELFMTLVHRISVLQCNLVYQTSAVSRAEKFLQHLKEQYLEECCKSRNGPYAFCFMEWPSEESILKRYMKSVKTATMLTSNDVPCYQLTEMMNMERRK